jgi:hypothetical protein
VTYTSASIPSVAGMLDFKVLFMPGMLELVTLLEFFLQRRVGIPMQVAFFRGWPAPTVWILERVACLATAPQRTVVELRFHSSSHWRDFGEPRGERGASLES